MSKKSIIELIITFLCISILLIGCNSKKVQTQTKGGLIINSWSSGLGSVDESNLDKSLFSYSINLTNENEKTIYIKSIQPLVDEAIKDKILSKETVVSVDKYIDTNETIAINGEVIVDTKGLAKEDIIKLQPFTINVKVTTEEIITYK